MTITERIDALCANALIDAHDRAAVADIQARLHEPLRVAIVGRVKAGKSTLLNALVGQRLAASDAGECTRVVTWYRNGATYDVTATLVDGSRESLSFRRDDGHLDIDLGRLRSSDIRRLDVTWPSLRLARMTLIDTPGLDGTDEGASDRTRAVVGLTEDDAGEVDAVIYLMRHLHTSDGEFLETFTGHAAFRPSPVNALAVLSRADEIGSARPDAMTCAWRVAQRYAADPRVSAVSAGVTPVTALLAEAGATLRESDVASLRAVASLSASELGQMLLSADRFATRDAPVSREARRDLLSQLGVFGVRLAVEELRAVRATTAHELSVSLQAASGVPILVELLDRHFSRRAEALKARSALARLRSLAQRWLKRHPEAARTFASEVERVGASAPELAALRLSQLVLSGLVPLNEADRREALRVAELTGGGSDAAEATEEPRRDIALERIEYWRVRASDPLASGDAREIADAIVHAYEVLVAKVGDRTPGSAVSRLAPD